MGIYVISGYIQEETKGFKHGGDSWTSLPLFSVILDEKRVQIYGTCISKNSKFAIELPITCINFSIKFQNALRKISIKNQIISKFSS